MAEHFRRSLKKTMPDHATGRILIPDLQNCVHIGQIPLHYHRSIQDHKTLERLRMSKMKTDYEE